MSKAFDKIEAGLKDVLVGAVEYAKTDKPFKPMLSATCEDITKIKYPVLVSPKLDGIRCLIRGGVAVSRNLKPIPNKYVQEKLKGLPDGLDGELIVGPATGDDVWNRSQSGVMSSDGEPDFTYWVFDQYCAAVSIDGFRERYEGLLAWEMDIRIDGDRYPVGVVPHDRAAHAVILAELEELYVSRGYEGVMIRDPNGAYKFGRSTVKEGGLLKLKRWHDAEAVVVDMVERMHNGNEATKDELGRTKRSTHKENKTGRGDMGALVCLFDTGPQTQVTFELGTGFTDEQRKGIWDAAKGANLSPSENPGCIGQIVTFKYQQLSPDGIPRFPVFKGFRHSGDISQ